MLASNFQSRLFLALTSNNEARCGGRCCVGEGLGWELLLSEALITDENLRHSGIKCIPFSRYGN